MSESKKEALAEFHRNTIGEVAGELFTKNGIDKTTMDQIAKKAGYSKSTIYVYFKSKEEINQYIILNAMTILRDKIKKTVSINDDFNASYYGMVSELIDFEEKYPIYFNSIVGELDVDFDCNITSQVLKDTFLVTEEIDLLMESMIKSGIEEGVLREDLDLNKTVFMLFGASTGVIKLAGSKKEYFEKVLKFSKQDFLDYSFKNILSSISK